MDVGVLHPGEMGAAVGAALVGTGNRVLWARTGRSEASAARASTHGLGAVDTVADLVRSCSVLVSVCPPHAARDVAAGTTGFEGVYVDANAIAPDTARQVHDLVVAGGARFVDGGIIGGPPEPGGDTRLYLSGSEAGMVADLFGGSPLATVVLAGDRFSASALKMTFSAWTKGTAALVLAIRAAARAEGVEEALVAEWAHSLPDLIGRSDGAARSATAKGWRWIGEMEEIAATMEADGLPGGFHRAAAEVYRRVPRRGPGGDGQDTASVVDDLLA